MTPTESLYLSLESAFNHFNERLFDNQLPPVIFTTQRQKGVMGYFSYNRWLNSKGADQCNEIAINPSYVTKSTTLELLQTLVHEMCHAYQYMAGKPSRNGYHNKEFAHIMESRGLMPSSTGRKGGKKTGQNMSDYAIPNGRFLNAAAELIEMGTFNLQWVDRYAKGSAHNEAYNNELANELGESLTPEAVAALLQPIVTEDEDHQLEPASQPAYQIKTCYHCLNCNFSLWGKANLKLLCLSCNKELTLKN